jgi:hypothetical protein
VQYGTIKIEEASIILIPFKGPFFIPKSIYPLKVSITIIENNISIKCNEIVV